MARPVWDIFCAVVDNYGDAAFGWRLAAQLADEHGIRPRLRIDRPDVLHALRPDVDPAADRQEVGGVEIVAWRTGEAPCVAPGDVVIDAFGCGLPADLVATMAAAPRRPLWVTTEYLSAEPWVPAFHGRASPHPATGLPRWFFFPGFVPGTGGVLRETGLDERMRAAARPEAIDALWSTLGFPPPAKDATVISLFGYANATVASMAAAWTERAAPTVLAVTRCPLAGAVAAALGAPDAGPGSSVRRGRLEARFLPFVPQEAYDRLLSASHWNFVRGEDSLCRALWARRPLVWQPYIQADGAHAAKLEAFSDWYFALAEGSSDRGTPAACRRFARAWSGTEGSPADAAAAWAQLEADRAALTRLAEGRAEALARVGEFAAQLVDFCEKRLHL